MSLCLRGALCGLVLLAGTAEARDGLTLQAAAGLGGLVKAGRWAPVQVEIESREAAGSTDLVVSWGDATLRRRVSLASAGRRRYELYLRTADATTVVRVRLETEPPQTLDVPVHVVPLGEDLTLCIATPEIAGGSQCAAVVAPQRLPDSARGYDAADAIVIATTTPLSARQERAIAEARAIHQLDISGDLALTPQVTRPLLLRGLPAPTSRSLLVMAAVYIAALVTAGVLASVFFIRSSFVWTAAALLTMAAVGASMMIGRVGPASRIRIHHSSLLQQIPGTHASLFTIRGVAELPADDVYDVRLAAEEAAIEASVASGRAEQVVDADGYPMLRGRFGLGARQAFVAEGTALVQPLAVTADGPTIRMTNTLDVPLTDCRPGYGIAAQDVPRLAPGATVLIPRPEEIAGPMFTCAMPSLPLAFSSASRDIDTTGSTSVVVYQPRRQAALPQEAPDD